MPRGPLPNPQRRRRNQPTLPTTPLPAAGRQGRTPRPPAWVALAKNGMAWWKQAWKTPQATVWDASFLPLIARRAELEDDLAVLGEVDSLDWADLLEAPSAAQFKRVVQGLAALASGRLSIFKEMREIEDRLGLSPKAMSALRWSFETDELEEPAASSTPNVRRLKIVDPHAVAGS